MTSTPTVEDRGHLDQEHGELELFMSFCNLNVKFWLSYDMTSNILLRFILTPTLTWRMDHLDQEHGELEIFMSFSQLNINFWLSYDMTLINITHLDYNTDFQDRSY